MRQGKLIVFEGLDGCGKSTQARLLAESLRADRRDVRLDAEPTDGEIGRLIRRILRGELREEPSAVAALFAADRIAHNAAIAPLLDSGTVVISDRYYYSSMAYQGVEADADWVRRLNLDCPYIKKPDLCVFLDASVTACLTRIRMGRSGTAPEIFENQNSLQAIRQRFDEVFAALPDEHVARVDAGGSPEEVALAVRRAVDAVL